MMSTDEMSELPTAHSTGRNEKPESVGIWHGYVMTQPLKECFPGGPREHTILQSHQKRAGEGHQC